MQIEILTIGRLTDRAYLTLIDEYLGRCRRRSRATLRPCRDADEMLARMGSEPEAAVALDERGQTLDSLAFARWLDHRLRAGGNRLSFCVGAAAGLDPRVRARAATVLTVAPWTLNHQLAILVLAEQLYRAFAILAGEPYHKP